MNSLLTKDGHLRENIEKQLPKNLPFEFMKVRYVAFNGKTIEFQ
jgi:hypothetical protein